MTDVVTKLASNGQADGPSALDRDEIASYHPIDETRLVGGLTERTISTEAERRRIADLARRLVENVRNDPETRRIRIIAMTGYYSEENVQRILAAGAETCLGKPFTPQQLLDALGLEREIAEASLA